MQPEEKNIWLTFIAALETAQSSPEDRAGRLRFCREFRSELVLLGYWLNRMKVTGCDLQIAADPPETCDLCSVNLTNAALFVDGQIADGRWSFMCMTCYGTHGVGIGWGVGQLYRLMPENETGERNWVSIAGGDPNPADSSSASMV